MRAAILLTAAMIVSACHSSGSAEEAEARVSRNFAVAGNFDRIALSGSPDVVVTVGGAPSIRADGESEMLDRLEITNENGELKIGLRPTAGSWFSWGSHHGLTVHVTLPALAGASITGSGGMRIDHVQGPAFAGAVTGSGDMNIANIATDQASFSITGSGDISAVGRAQTASASVTGSGDLRLSQLEAATATIALAGSGDIGIRATGTAAIDSHGSGDVTVAGPARCTISKSGSGDVRCNA